MPGRYAELVFRDRVFGILERACITAIKKAAGHKFNQL
jgi:hypothetical protein